MLQWEYIFDSNHSQGGYLGQLHLQTIGPLRAISNPRIVWKVCFASSKLV